MIEVEDLSFGYRRGEPIIDGLTWTFPAGRLTAVTGVSGRGKSTLLYLLGLLLTPWSGRVRVAGETASVLGDRVRSRLRGEMIGFVFQDALLDPSRTVVDNVVEGALYSRVSRRQAQQRALGLLDRFDVRLRAGHRPGEVSGGQAQRVALCRALVGRPRVILADEPTGNLDGATAQVVLDALTAAARQDDTTVVVASHSPDVVDCCDQVLKL
jgi:lipoprotein-releasing system ATP-binding protein